MAASSSTSSSAYFSFISDGPFLEHGSRTVNTLPFCGVLVTMDPAAMLLDDAVADAQAQAGPLSHRFGREERLKDPLEMLFGNADAVVLDLDFNGSIERPRPDPDIAPVVDRLEGIQEQVHQDLVQLARIALNLRDISHTPDGSRPGSCTGWAAG